MARPDGILWIQRDDSLDLNRLLLVRISYC